MKRFFLILITSLVTMTQASAMQAATDNDFVARMMKQINSRPSSYDASDYKQITVSPTMMQSVLEMLASADMPEAQDKEIVSKLLHSVKSLRIFIASDNINAYQTLVNKVIQDNKKIYRKFKSPKASDNNAHIWTRQAGGKVIEIIALLDRDDKNPEMRILNLTGEFNDEFINLLVKMPN